MKKVNFRKILVLFFMALPVFVLAGKEDPVAWWSFDEDGGEVVVDKVSGVEDEIRGIVEVYIERNVMPRNPLGDALHLALASYYKFDYLLTWNCKHLANANKFNHIRQVNTLLGLHVPILTTPLELMGGE